MATRGASSDIKSRFYSREMEKLRYWLQKRPLQRELLQAQSQGDEREFLLRALKFSSVYVTEEELGPPQHLRPSGRGRAGVAGGGARGVPTYQLSTPTPSTTPPATKYSDVIFPTRFQCRTASCSPYDLYVLYDNKTESDKTKHMLGPPGGVPFFITNCRDILNDD
eukprot:g4360.t1